MPGTWNAMRPECHTPMMHDTTCVHCNVLQPITPVEKITNQENSYQFSFFGWRDSYDTFAGQVIKFSGEMMGDHFTIELKDSNAYYTDDVLILVDEFPLYNKGEERCKVHFMFNGDFITVQTLDCNFIYGGFGVAFDGGAVGGLLHWLLRR